MKESCPGIQRYRGEAPAPPRGGPIEKTLILHTEVPDDETVPGEELAGRAVAALLFPDRDRRHPACAEEFSRLVLPEGILQVTRAYMTGLPADLPVLFRILYPCRVRFLHDEGIYQRRIIGFPWSIRNEKGNQLSFCPER